MVSKRNRVLLAYPRPLVDPLMPELAMFYLDLLEEAGLLSQLLGDWLAAEILICDRSRFRNLVQLAPAGTPSRPYHVAMWRQLHLGARRGGAS
jgi:hypothetical protein